MLLSVILPVRDGERFVRDAVASVLDQTDRPPVELVVVDDGSLDGSVAAVRALCPGAVVLRSTGLGPAGARNVGLRAATGDIVGFIDHDDVWPAHKLAAHLRFFDDEAVDIVGGPTSVAWIAEPGREVAHMLAAGRRLPLHNLGAYLMRRRVFDRVGLLDDSLTFGEDVDFFFRVREAGLALHMADEPGLIYRIHGDNMTCGRRPADLGLLDVVKRLMERRADRVGSRDP